MSGSSRPIDPLDAVDEQLAELCGQLNAVTAQIVRVIAEVAESGAWSQTGCKSLAAWVSWKCGLSPARAHALVATAKVRDEFPEVVARFDAGQLSEDQVGVIARRAPQTPEADRHFAELAEYATVSQLRTALRIVRQPPVGASDDERDGASEPPSMSFGYDDEGRWRCTIDAPAVASAEVDTALRAAKDSLYQQWKRERDASDLPRGDFRPPPTNFDALVRMAQLSTSEEARLRPHYAGTRTILHVDVESDVGKLHLGPVLSQAERSFLSCDSSWELWLEKHGVPIGVGRTSRHIPDRLRRYCEERDGGMCTHPGCSSTIGLQLHHIEFYEHGGPTESWNLTLQCSFDHHRIHDGTVSVSGNADEPGGLVWKNRHGNVITGASLARPPTTAPPDVRYRGPTGERAQWKWYSPPTFN